MKIFLSYRREDSIHQSGRIHEWLCNHFGKDDIFFDVDSIPPGTNWKIYLEDRIGRCDVLLVPIGDHWLTIMQQRADQTDMVRHEIEAALRRGIPIIPLQVGSAPMPSESSLPDSIQELTSYQGVPIRPGADFRTDMSGLIEALEREFGTSPIPADQNLDRTARPTRNETANRTSSADRTLEEYPRSLKRTLAIALGLAIAAFLLSLVVFGLAMPSTTATWLAVLAAMLVFFSGIGFLSESKIVLPFSGREQFELRMQSMIQQCGSNFRLKGIYSFPLVHDKDGRQLFQNSWGRILVVSGEHGAEIIGHSEAIKKFSKALAKLAE